MALNKFKSKIITLLNRRQLKIQEQLQNRKFFISHHMPFKPKNKMLNYSCCTIIQAKEYKYSLGKQAKSYFYFKNFNKAFNILLLGINTRALKVLMPSY